MSPRDLEQWSLRELQLLSQMEREKAVPDQTLIKDIETEIKVRTMPTPALHQWIDDLKNKMSPLGQRLQKEFNNRQRELLGLARQ